MDKVGIVVLCRYSSSRLLGKILKEIEGKQVITYILERLEAVVDKANIIIATSNETSDNPIEAYANKHQYKVFRGSLSNVAERFVQAGKQLNTPFIARINGDNIFLDGEVLEEMIAITHKHNYDFISNVKNRTYPKGMSIEIVKTSYYERLLNKITVSAYHREHVTSFLYENETDNFYFHYNTALKEAGGLQFALDDQNDFERTQTIIAHFKQDHTQYNLKEIYQIYKEAITHE